jgi:hypothetical protein
MAESWRRIAGASPISFNEDEVAGVSQRRLGRPIDAPAGQELGEGPQVLPIALDGVATVPASSAR